MINRTIIYPDLKIFSNGLSYNYDEIILKINQAKNYLHNKLLTKGQIVCLCVTTWPDFLIWFIACSELGLILATLDHENLKDSSRLDLYNVEYIINEDDDFSDSAETDIFINIKSTDVLMYSSSSGTFGKPKIVSYTHEFCYQLMKRNSNVYQLTSDDRCLHTKGLQHGAIVPVYFLPTIHSCKYHYYTSCKEWFDILPTVSRCLLYYDMINGEIPKSLHTTFYTLTPIADNLINNNTIFSIFGCTETSGPLFLPQLPIIENCFGPALDNFYKFTVEDRLLIVELPDNSIVQTGDYFESSDDKYYFYGRYKSEITNIINTIESLNLVYQKDFDIVIDTLYNKIYLRLDTNIKLPVTVDLTVVEPRSNFMYGIKFDAERFRNYCRRLA